MGVTQKAASYLRPTIPDLEGLIVPSVAFLDHPKRSNVVIYRDRIDLASTFGKPAFVRTLALDGNGG